MIYIYNPQASMYGISLWGQIIKKKEHDKLAYILDLIRDNPEQYKVITDGLVSSFPYFHKIKPAALMKLASYIELYIWCFLNKIPFASVTTKEPNKDDVIFFMANKSSVLTSDLYKKSLISNVEAKKVMHLSHFFENTKKVSEHAKECSVDFTIAEANLNETSEYYRKYYSNYIKQHLTVPFFLRDKYKKTTNFSERKNKCLAIGTTHLMKKDKSNEDFQNFFGVQCWHQMRRIIYDNSTLLEPWIDSKISDYHADEKFKDMKGKYAHITKKLFGHRQSNYMSFDIVKTYNEYKMFVSPEEEVGLPSINFIEGMACGCLYFGADKKIYDELGMKDGLHYVHYEKNSVESLTAKIKFYQENTEMAETIAKNGCEFALMHFSRREISKLFSNNLLSI